MVARAPVWRTKKDVAFFVRQRGARATKMRTYGDQRAIKGRIRKLVALLSHFVRPRVAQAISFRLRGEGGAKVGRMRNRTVF